MVKVARVVEVVVVFDLGRKAPALVPYGSLEPTIQRTVRVRVAEVPLPEETCRVSVLGEDLGHRANVPPHEVAAGRHHPGLVAEGVEASHQLSPGRRAYGCDMKVREPDALVMELIHGGCLEDGIAVSRHVAVPLVIGKDDDDVRARGIGCWLLRAADQKSEQSGYARQQAPFRQSARSTDLSLHLKFPLNR